MKISRFTLLVISVFCLSCIAKSQDLIIKNDNSTIEVKVTKISATEIEYKKWSNLDGPVYVIEKTEVSGIKYQNGEIESFTTPAEPNSQNFMMRDGRQLTLDGRVLSDEEVKSLISEDQYKTYISARNQIHYGDVDAVLLAGSTIAAVYFYVVGIKNQNEFYTTIGLVSSLSADVFLALLIINKSAGKGRLAWIADEYNRQHHGYTLSFSPSISNCITPQSQNNYALGMTLRLNF